MKTLIRSLCFMLMFFSLKTYAQFPINHGEKVFNFEYSGKQGQIKTDGKYFYTPWGAQWAQNEFNHIDDLKNFYPFSVEQEYPGSSKVVLIFSNPNQGKIEKRYIVFDFAAQHLQTPFGDLSKKPF